MSRLRTLTAEQARRTLAHRLTPLIDRVRQKFTDFGLRAYPVSLVWTRWGGQERGEGHEVVVRRLSILPNPLVQDLTGVTMNPYAAGLLPVGSVRVTQISQRYAQDLLLGLVMPCDPQASFESQLHGGPPVDLTEQAIETESVPESWEFFWEIVEDGRSNDGRKPPRHRYRPFSAPFRSPETLGFEIVLERVSKDLARSGNPRDD